MTAIPRPEHPRPQFRRDRWLTLNGTWGFEVDQGDSGIDRGLVERELSGTITVPFAPEAPLSGIGASDWLNAVWYRRSVTVPAAWEGARVLLHIQAADYDTTVWVGGRQVTRHRGGATPISVDISDHVTAGSETTIVIRCRDDHRKGPQPIGKQTNGYGPYGVLYPRTTGIWQTVWLEAVGTTHLARPRITPDLGDSCFRLEQRLTGPTDGLRVTATLRDSAGVVTVATRAAGSDPVLHLTLPIPDERRRLWSPADPHLYDLEVALVDGAGDTVDLVHSYAGLRSVTISGPAILLNGEPLFQRLVLDQGYWPEGVMTAPSDNELIADITRAQAVGFNGARLHQRVAEERFLYHCDRLGYIVWGEFCDWGCANWGRPFDHQQPTVTWVTQWLEAVERDYSHPAIVGWCPLNETHQLLHDRITVLDDTTAALFLATKAADRTRPVIDASGYSHRIREADVWDAHDYDQDPATFRTRWDAFTRGEDPDIPGERAWSVPWAGQPILISEFGGTAWTAPSTGGGGWGYGEEPASPDDFLDRFRRLCSALLENPGIAGYCWTQLTDTYQEQNGVYTFDRRSKFDTDLLRSVQTAPAAIERESGVPTPA